MKIKPFLLLVGIFILGSALRLVYLNSAPSTIFEDEILHGYLGKFLWQNGIDLYGNHWPLLYFDKFGDYFIIGPIYLSGLAVHLLGNTDFAIRFPTAVLGSFTILVFYFITKLWTKSTQTALLSSVLLALLPWHVVLSRVTAESIMESLFILIGLIGLIQFYRKQKLPYIWLVFTVISFCFAGWLYHVSRLAVPMILLSASVLFASTRVHLGKKVALFITTLGFFLIVIYIFSTPWGKGRASQTSIFSPTSPTLIRTTELSNNLGPNNVFLARAFYNKVIGYFWDFGREYVRYFSLDFLLYNGWQNTMYQVPHTGPVYFTVIGGLLILFLPFGKRLTLSPKAFLGLVLFLAIAPIPASFTIIDSPNLRRSLLLVFPLLMLSALGWDKFLRSFPNYRKQIILVLCALLSLEALNFSFQYVKQYSQYSSLFRNDGYRELAQYLGNHRDSFTSPVYVPHTGALPLYYLYYANDFNPSYAGLFGKDLAIKNIGPYYFVPEWCPSQGMLSSPDHDLTLVESQSCGNVPSGYYVNTRIVGINPMLGFRIATAAAQISTNSLPINP